MGFPPSVYNADAVLTRILNMPETYPEPYPFYYVSAPSKQIKGTFREKLILVVKILRKVDFSGQNYSRIS